MPKLVINGTPIEVLDGTTVLQACQLAEIEVPRFCYHERLAVAGNCRMCLVEIEKTPKPVASCAQPAIDGMVIHTNTHMVKKAREGVLEFLLINHPLDCPICDQGGECDLQDQTMKYGKGYSRYTEEKRAVVDKYMGPLIKTHMTRCIHCTRCVRFLEDIAGTTELGAIGRGENMQITNYLEKAITSEISGNIIDLCPVGALTSRPYAFKARSWELEKTESIDVLDAVGSNIRIDSRGREVMRILPRLNEAINEEWISDKTRFAYDGLKYQRLDVPMMQVDGKFVPIDWDEAYDVISSKIRSTSPDKIGAIAGDLTDVETMLIMREFLEAIGSKNYDCRQDGSLIGNAERALYIFNTTIAGIEKADHCLIVGSNPRHESALLNTRLRKGCVQNNLKIALLGTQVDLSYPYRYLGNNPWILKQITENEHNYCSILAAASKPMLIVGASVMARPDAEAFVYYIKKISSLFPFIQEDWNGINILQRVASRVGGLDIGFIPAKNGYSTRDMLDKMDVLFLLGADEIDLQRIPDSTFIVYQGHHGDIAAYRANVILPSPAFTEKDATYVNLEGRAQHTYRAVHPPNQAKREWLAIIDLAESMGIYLKYKTLSDIRARMATISPVFQFIGNIVPASSFNNSSNKSRDFTLDHFSNPIKNFYMTDSISRHSKIMAKCTEAMSTHLV